MTLCGIELFPRDEAGKLIPRGWGRRGGDTGPNCRRVPCPRCRDAAAQVANFVAIEDRTFNLDWRKPKESTLPADIESTWELTEAERLALPPEYHQPVWMDLTTPKGWICAQCWGDSWATDWPCKVAGQHGKAVAKAGGMKIAG